MGLDLILPPYPRSLYPWVVNGITQAIYGDLPKSGKNKGRFKPISKGGGWASLNLAFKAWVLWEPIKAEKMQPPPSRRISQLLYTMMAALKCCHRAINNQLIIYWLYIGIYFEKLRKILQVSFWKFFKLKIYILKSKVTIFKF